MPDQTKLEYCLLDGAVQCKEFAPVDTFALELDAFAETVLGWKAFSVTARETLYGVALM